MRFEVPFNVEVEAVQDRLVPLSGALDALEKYSPEYFVSTKASLDPFELFQQEVVANKIGSKIVHSGLSNPEVPSGAAQDFRREVQDILVEQFSRRLQLQNSQIDTLVTKELERRRIETERIQKAEEERKRQEEERKRRIEAEAKRKAEEEKKRLEEERKKKEEEEKRKKAEDERLRKQKEEEAKKKEEEAKKKAELDRQTQASLAHQSHSITNFNSIAKQFAQYKQTIKDIKNNVKIPMENDGPLLKSVNPYKRKLNAKFGQLSNSRSQLEAVNLAITEILQLASKADEQLIYKWLLNFVAKAIVDQAETEVVTSPHMAVPLAMLAMNLLLTFPELEYFLTARFVKKCPYILGYTTSIDTENGRYNMGWKRRDQIWEDEVKYEERVSGIGLVWAEMTSIATKDMPEQLSFYTMSSSWSFIARLLNLQKLLLLSTHFTLAGNWWEACAEEFYTNYGKQGIKLLRALCVDWPLLVTDKKFAGAARLLIIGEEWVKTGKFQKLKKMEP